MHRRQVLTAALAASLSFVLLSAGKAADAARITGPVVHENLAIYFVHGKSAPGPVPLTLEEALTKGVVKVHETGKVNELSIENLGQSEVFVNSGDIVKGGQQDRALTVSLMLPPMSGLIPISAFCVEQGRWTARGKEDVRTFATASALLPSRDAKLAMAASPPVLGYAAASGPSQAGGVDTGSRQQQVWSSVALAQRKLSDRVGTSVASAQSQTSLQLSLENEKLKTAQGAYLKALSMVPESQDDIVGYVFAINGKINSAEVYPSTALFRKMWGKLLAASVTEAIGERDAAAGDAPSVETVQAFLDGAERGKATEKVLPVKNLLEAREAEASLYLETRGADGAWTHRSHLAK